MTIIMRERIGDGRQVSLPEKNFIVYHETNAVQIEYNIDEMSKEMLEAIQKKLKNGEY